ncbi:MAG: Stp1/IreP family PP2C-type Ser/Thr phosphatase [Clostridia bacterium]|nr:Stp1/IreP family PP2C-type Ser/Thr phosphatase [Clostridia bacterium]
MNYHGLSDVGQRRANNQDSFSVKEYKCGAVLGTVCDGMGGASGGKTASELAGEVFVRRVDDLFEEIPSGGEIPSEDEIAKALFEAVCDANREVHTRSEHDRTLEGMGTTLVASLVFEDRIFTINVGDSRMYLIDSGRIVQVTHDHSYVQYLVDIGKMTSEEAASSVNKNIITRAVGTEEEIEPDIYLTDVKKSGKDDRIFVLLCTDGLSNHVTPDEILEVVTSSRPDGDGAVASLIERANANGGSDNITALLISL